MSPIHHKSMDDNDINATLLAEYSRSIDTSTILAILSDFDLNDTAQVDAARQTLDILRDSILEEEQSGFDPSAAARGGHGEGESISTRSAPGWSGSISTANTEISQDILSDLDELNVEDQRSPSISSKSAGGSGQDTPVTQESYPSTLDALDDAGKEKAFMAIFPALKEFDVKWTLKKSNYDASLAIDELMTQSFLEESGGRHKGIDAFSESSSLKAKKKGKKKGKGRGALCNDENESQFKEETVQTQWEKGRQDIEFLSQKTGMPIQQIGSLYHKSGANVKATIRAIINAHLEIGLSTDDDAVLQLNVYEMRAEFPTLQSADLEALLQITTPSLVNAHELAKALTSQETTIKKGGIKIEFRHAPPDLSSETLRSPLTPSKASNALLPAHLDHSIASSQAHSLQASRQAAYAQASSAFRKSKSDPLYGGAASYYSQVAREYSDRARNMESAAADALIATQSSRTELDLHGVNVKDAVRISREKVMEWWVRECEERARLGRPPGSEKMGYRIVTGMGRHSEGGKGKLGPAVGSMLIREGWKIEVGSGAIVVRGVVKK